MITLISLAGNTVSLVSLPISPNSATTGGYMASIDWAGTNAVSTVTSIFTGQVQVQKWPGADTRSGTATLPPLTQEQAKPWKAALLQLNGQANAFQIGDPTAITPQGTALGTPVIDGSIPITAGGGVLYTKGWTPNQVAALKPFDYIQVGYRLHTVLDTVVTDSNGKAAINIWPSLREVFTDGEPVITENAVGLFRLAGNKVTWSEDFTKLCHISFQFSEYR